MMRNSLALISLALFVATADLAFGRCYAAFHFYYCLHHADGSDGPVVLTVWAGREIEVTSQVSARMLFDFRYRQTMLPRVGPMHVFDIPPSCLLPIFAVYPLVRLRAWLRRRGPRRRGFPVFKEEDDQPPNVEGSTHGPRVE